MSILDGLGESMMRKCLQILASFRDVKAICFSLIAKNQLLARKFNLSLEIQCIHCCHGMANESFLNNGRLAQQQTTFNHSLSKARVLVEHSYGLVMLTEEDGC